MGILSAAGRYARLASKREASAFEDTLLSGFDGQRRTYNTADRDFRMPQWITDGTWRQPYRSLANEPFDDRTVNAILDSDDPYALAVQRQQRAQSANPFPDQATRRDDNRNEWIQGFENVHGRPPESAEEMERFFLQMQAVQRQYGIPSVFDK